LIGVDTNVLLRFLVDDEPEQNQIARRVLAERSADDPVFISAVTLAETVWLLMRKLDYSICDVSAMLRDLLASDGVIVEHGDELDFLLGRGNAPAAELADYLIAWSGLAAGCSRTLTFDRRAARAVPSMELLA
jgi:predicted nucleic-acid-binding protein